jgi:hypothetical protein
MHSYETVTEALNELKSRGYDRNFNVAFDKITCSETDACLSPEEFEIVEVHRFEGDSNPEDEDVVYAVESKDGKMKGVITAAFGTYADTISNKILQKLKIHI